MDANATDPDEKDTLKPVPVDVGGFGMYVYENRAANAVVTRGTPGAPTAAGPLDRLQIDSRVGFKEKSYPDPAAPPGDPVDPLMRPVTVRVGLTDPPSMHVPVRNGPLESIGELGLLFTVCHTDVETFGERLYAEVRGFAEDPAVFDEPGLGPEKATYPPAKKGDAAGEALRRRYHAPTSNFSRVGRLRWAEFPRRTEPRLPVAMTVFDAFDIVGYEANVPFVAGRVNLNTAAARALEALPYMSDLVAGNLQFRGDTMPGKGGDGPYGPAAALVAYRDVRRDTAGFRYYDFTVRPRGWRDGLTGPGFASVGEMLAARDVRTFNAIPEFAMDVAARDRNGESVALRQFQYMPSSPYWKSPRDGNYPPPNDPAQPPVTMTSGPFAGPDDDGIGDVRKQLALFIPAANLVDLRSDVFTAHFVLVGLRFEPGVLPTDKGTWAVGVRRTFTVLFDRSNVERAGDRPRVLQVT